MRLQSSSESTQLLIILCLTIIIGLSALNMESVLRNTRKALSIAPILISSTNPFRIQRPSKIMNTPIVEKRIRENKPESEIKQNRRQYNFQFVRNAVQTVGPSVVRIDCDREITNIMSIFSDNKEGDLIKVAGTGIIASNDGYILTNAHVVDAAKRVTVSLSNGRSFKAKVIASDEFTDLAVIKADISKETDFVLRKAPMGDSSSLHAGDWVIAVGCPVGLDFTVTLGVVSSPKRSAVEVNCYKGLQLT